MKNKKLKSWNAHNLAKEANVNYDKFARALNHETGKTLSYQECEDILSEAKESLKYLRNILQKGRSL